MKDCENRDGQQFGNYRLDKCLGGGGFACVYKGEHVFLGTHAAIKLLLKDRLTKEEREAFLTEARTIARLEHPHIVPVLEFGIEAGIPFLVMAYKAKGSLRQIHPKGSRLPLPTIISCIKQVAEALQYAHDQKVVHRDIKPDNFLVGSHGEVLLSDFGIAVTAHGTRSWVRQNIAGTEPYMAPEQFRAQAIPASDQYSLGIVVYEWLCGERPFTEGDMGYHHNHTPPPLLRNKVQPISPAVEEVVLKALAKDPRQRFVNILAFAQALEQACQPKPPIGTTLLIYRGHCGGMYKASWSHDGKYIASVGHDGTVQVWDPTSGATISVYRHYPERSFKDRVQWSDDDRHLISTDSSAVVIWEASTRRHIHTYNYKSSISPNGKYLFEMRRLDMWRLRDMITGETIFTYDDILYLAEWSLDSKYLLFSGSYDKTIQVRDTTSGTLVFTHSGHATPLRCVAWSPDATRIASGSSAKDLSKMEQYLGTNPIGVKVWDTATGRNISTYSRFGIEPVNIVAWSPDGTRIVSASSGMHVWQAK